MKFFGRLPEDDLNQVSLKLRKTLLSLSMSNVVVVGASGFLGEWVSTFFLYASRQQLFDGDIVLMSRRPGQLSSRFEEFNSMRFKAVNSVNFTKADLSFLRHRKTFVIYAATSTNLSDEIIFKNRQEATWLPEKIVSFLGNQDVTFIHLSSGGVYEKDSRLLTSIPGSTKIQNNGSNPYLDEKIAIEKWSNAAEKQGLIVARNPRLFTFYGPGLQLDRHFAIGEFMRLARAHHTIVIKGRPDNRRSFLYPTDAIEQLLDFFAGTNPAHSQIGSANTMTIEQAARVIGEEYGVPVLIETEENSAIDNYVPADISTKFEKDFLSGVRRWGEWLDHLR